jgi:hypothetical protein
MVDLESTLVGAMLVVDTSNTPINADALPTFRVYGPSGFVEDSSASFRDSDSVTTATNASPIVITFNAHGLTTGTRVTITGVGGNDAANGTFVITRVDANHFSLDGSAGDGEYTAGGTWNVTGLYAITINATGTSGYEKGENYQVLALYDVSSTATGQLLSFQVS